MPYKLLSDKEIVNAYQEFKVVKTVDINKLDNNHRRIREFMLDKYNSYKKSGLKTYMLDLMMGLELYDFLQKEEDFTYEYQTNISFWKYVAVCDIPDIIMDRFGIDNEAHFYKKNLRIYPYSIYWYIYLSWQGDNLSTIQALQNNSTDEILQLVERPGKIGISVELMRELMLEYSKVPKNQRTIMIGNKEYKLFRLIIMKNLAKQTVLRPELYPGGIKGFVNMLFEDYLKKE